MKTYIDSDGSVSCSSACQTSWERIYTAGKMSKKKIKSGTWVSAVHRHPGECQKILSAKTQRRKADTAAKIARIKTAEKKYLYLAANEKAKVTVDKKTGQEMVLVRNNGKFTGEKVVFA